MKADYLSNRTVKITRDDYFKFLIMYHDGRFARDPRFRFFAMNTLLRHKAISECNLYIRRNKLLDKLDIKSLKENIQDDPSLVKNIMVFAANLRSTRPYWNQRCSELLAMVEQLGKPAVFFTLTAADYHWRDIFRLINPNVDPTELSEGDRAKLMHDNPILTGYFYHEWVRIFLNKVVKPIFNVTDMWYRHEWQSRGSGHTHGVLWIKDAPDIDDANPSDEEIENIKKYFDTKCFAFNPCMSDTSDNIPTTSSEDASVWEHPCRKNFSDIPDQ